MKMGISGVVVQEWTSRTRVLLMYADIPFS